MKIVIAPDSYKGALRADKVAQALADGWRQVRKNDRIITIPLSDGGEGMAHSLAVARDGKYVKIKAHDALMRPISTSAVLIGDTAIIETAEANGIEKLQRSELNPMAATTYGVGEMIIALLDMGCRQFIAGIGGSATVDGGAGMVQALGAKLLDQQGNLLPVGAGGGVLRHVSEVDISAMDPRIADCTVKVACDVTNPLCGHKGAAAVFGPQKGATAEMVPSLDENLKHWASLFGDDGMHDGDGAAGGLGFAMRCIMHAELVSGAKLIMQYSGFNDAVSDADLVITGEGCSDEQTAFGKLCACVAANPAGVPTVLVSGALRGDISVLEKIFHGCFSIASGPCTLDEAIAATQKNLQRMGANLARLTGR